METRTCKNCKSVVSNESKFCSACGSSITRSSVEFRESGLTSIITFYVAIIAFIVISYYISDNFPNNFTVELSIEIIFAVLVVFFSFFDYRSILALYKPPKLSLFVYLITFVIPIGTALSVYFTIEIVNGVTNPELSSNYYVQHLYLDYPLLWSIIFVAILPPIFEELAFRGYLYNQLRKVTSDKNTIIATAFLFALIHFSFLSLIWIFPFGLLLGYFRKKYNTLWLGMIIHFIHNFIVLILDYYFYSIS